MFSQADLSMLIPHLAVVMNASHSEFYASDTCREEALENPL
jgi:hypothetical protein